MSMIAVVVTLLVLAIVAKPTGRYVAMVFSHEKTKLDRVFMPVENGLLKLSGVSSEEQSWKKYAFTLLLVNVVMIAMVYVIFRLQGVLPWNPTNIAGMEPSTAFNTAISFMTNTNLQHYSGETGLSMFSQLTGIVFLMFTSPATGLAVAMAFIRGISGKPIGNYYVDMIRAMTRIYLPGAIVIGVIFIALGMPQTLSPSITAQTLSGVEQTILRGPFGAFEAIKQLGNNGGGLVGMNSAHPFENPNGMTNALQIICMLLLPASLPFTYGYMTRNKKQGSVLFGAMAAMFIVFLSISILSASGGNPALEDLGPIASGESMEGKETRFGVVQSLLFAITTTASETGAVNAMHDSLLPIAGMLALANMMLNTVFGGVGVGLMNVLLYAILAVFIAGLLVGRTPEFLGKKIESKEMTLLALTLLVQPLMILGFSALAVSTGWGTEGISNPGFHGLTQVVYEYTSSVANNGSGFEGLGDATPFWNITTGIAMFIGRYFSIVALMAVAGSLAMKNTVPQTTGTFRTDQPLFGGILIGTTFIVGALTYLPILVLGPIAELLTLS
ncbi:potassium-transporting ATPase subunit KdpA [Aureibacillus halotolerans]|uniref:potassium-transporting ATPase subunit KdpA n=1 Tax=Aureibacillus halotolerans TaxID=1508390 RepID=UPI00105D478D|nr:potassium-transporting ATPase subunit KdpA [Aureibacillus halotolerans]